MPIDLEDDEEELMRDGESRRFPLYLMDSVQRAIALGDEPAEGLRLHDGRGGPVGHRPGFVYATDAAGLDAVEQAYQLHKAEIGAAWRGGLAVGDHLMLGGHGLCEVTRRHEDGSTFVRQSAGDAVERAYADYDAAISNAWRGGR